MSQSKDIIYMQNKSNYDKNKEIIKITRNKDSIAKQTNVLN